MKKAILKIQTITVPQLSMKYFSAAVVFVCGALTSQMTLIFSGSETLSFKVFLSVVGLSLLTLSWQLLMPVVKKSAKHLGKLPAPELSMKLLVPATVAAVMALILELVIPFITL